MTGVAEHGGASPLNALLCLSACTLQIHSLLPGLALSMVLVVPFSMVTDILCSSGCLHLLPGEQPHLHIRLDKTYSR